MARLLSPVELGFGACSAVSAVATVVMAWRGQGRQSRREEAEEAAKEGELVATLKGVQEALERAFKSIKENTERYQKHELECARDKATMASEMAGVSKSQEQVVRSIEALNRQVAYMARDRGQDALRDRGLMDRGT